MGMESHHCVTDDITPFQVFSSLGGFAARRDCRISGPSATRRRLLTLLKFDVDADVEWKLLDDGHNS